MRVCAIDCGSNSFHLLIADIEDKDQFEIIADDKSLLFLGTEVAHTNKISDESLLRAKRVIRHYRNLIKRHQVDIVKCVATSALRSANNGDEIITSLSKTLGHEIAVISGHKEAEIIYRGISAVSSLPEKRVLNIDMGGSSLELMTGKHSLLEYASSEPLGASRLATELGVNDPLDPNDIRAIKEKCKSNFIEFKKMYPANSFLNIVASSGTLTSIISMARAKADGFISSSISNISASSKEMSQICEILIKTNKKDRKNILGYDSSRSTFMQTAAVITMELSKLAKKDSPWYSSPFALREGLVLLTSDEAIGRNHSTQKEVAEATINTIERKQSAIENTLNELTLKKLDRSNHSKNVMMLSEQLFKQLSSIHNMGNDELTILKYAARLHDIGTTISKTKHDLHGAYILFNTSLPGFTPNHATILRSLVRGHRNRDPRLSDKYVGRLEDDDLLKAKWLCAILRIADGADSGKTNSVTRIDISINPDIIHIYLTSERDIELEIYSTRKKRLLLEEISSRDVVVSQDRTDQASTKSSAYFQRQKPPEQQEQD